MADYSTTRHASCLQVCACKPPARALSAHTAVTAQHLIRKENVQVDTNHMDCGSRDHSRVPPTCVLIFARPTVRHNRQLESSLRATQTVCIGCLAIHDRYPPQIADTSRKTFLKRFPKLLFFLKKLQLKHFKVYKIFNNFGKCF